MGLACACFAQLAARASGEDANTVPPSPNDVIPAHISSPALRGSPTPAVPAADAPEPLPDSATPVQTVSGDTPAPPSQNVTINLINLMVKRGLLTKDDAQGLIQQAEQEAATARAQTGSAVAENPAAPGPAATEQANTGDDVQVNYVPNIVKQQITDEVRDDVMKEARDEHWAAPNTLPEWVTRYHVSADLRVRYEGDFYPSGNDDDGIFHNFNSINTGSPFDNGVNSVAANPPSYDVNEDRERFRLRARFGAWVDVGSGFTAGLRLGTGQDDNPVTENQTIGLANNGQGGNFSKYAIWLDRAFLRYQWGKTTDQQLTTTIGRMDNPFFASSMIWANDLGFDGLVVQGRYKVEDGIVPFFTAGGFPVFNTDFNFATTSGPKFASEDKYLLALQTGADWKITKDLSAKFAGALYYFENVEGKVSDPFTPLFSSDGGNTDDSRPSFAQNGNTYIALRDIVPDAANGNGTIDQFQYFGLATPFHEVALTGQLDYSKFDPFHISLLGEVVNNFAFDRHDIETNGPPQEIGPVNNVTVAGDPGSFVGGSWGYNVRLTLGTPILAKLWDWNLNLTYRYVETDATVDGFTDSDFGTPLTGTNLQGYIIGGNLAITPRVWTSLQFMSADAIAGPTFHSDLIQVDLNAKF